MSEVGSPKVFEDRNDVARRVTAVFPGSFDPITRGHEDVARRTLGIADHVIVAVAKTVSKGKSPMFGVDERVALVNEVFADEGRITADILDGLLVDFARARRARFVVRGLRAISDFEYEMQMAQMNRELWQEIETVFLVPDVRHSFLSSSLVREVAALGGDVTDFIPPQALDRVLNKLDPGTRAGA